VRFLVSTLNIQT